MDVVDDAERQLEPVEYIGRSRVITDASFVKIGGAAELAAVGGRAPARQVGPRTREGLNRC